MSSGLASSLASSAGYASARIRVRVAPGLIELLLELQNDYEVILCYLPLSSLHSSPLAFDCSLFTFHFPLSAFPYHIPGTSRLGDCHLVAAGAGIRTLDGS